MNEHETQYTEFAADFADDRPVESTAKMRDEAVQRKRRLTLVAVLVAAAIALLAAGFEPWRVGVAILVAYVLLQVGFGVIGSFARPIPAPPPPGELRKVKLTYRCSSCGAELRMQLANDEVPDPPRHCADDMELLTDLNEL